VSALAGQSTDGDTLNKPADYICAACVARCRTVTEDPGKTRLGPGG
jgi:hypothetical protein